jgi:hypothetical protein
VRKTRRGQQNNARSGTTRGLTSASKPGGDLEPLQGKTGLSLLFAPGKRPSASDLDRLIHSAADSGIAARISHRPPDDHGWLELLASGLTFDLRGLAPGTAAPIPPVGPVYGLPADVDRFEFEAISLGPGSNVGAGGTMMPVVRILLGLAANLALQLPISAVCWNPARSWMEPRYFGRVAVTWLSGGAFPALGLTGVRRRSDGAFESTGLAYFTGQEVCVRGHEGEVGSDTIKLAARVVDHLVRHGPLQVPDTLPCPSGAALMLQPSSDGRFVEVSRRI